MLLLLVVDQSSQLGGSVRALLVYGSLCLIVFVIYHRGIIAISHFANTTVDMWKGIVWILNQQHHAFGEILLRKNVPVTFDLVKGMDEC
jgi:hypothetical protein